MFDLNVARFLSLLHHTMTAGVRLPCLSCIGDGMVAACARYGISVTFIYTTGSFNTTVNGSVGQY